MERGTLQEERGKARKKIAQGSHQEKDRGNVLSDEIFICMLKEGLITSTEKV